MKFIEYGSEDFFDFKACWFILGAKSHGKDIFKAEFEKTNRNNFAFGCQLGGDCLFNIYFLLGKFAGGITIWGY